MWRSREQPLFLGCRDQLVIKPQYQIGVRRTRAFQLEPRQQRRAIAPIANEFQITGTLCSKGSFDQPGRGPIRRQS